MPFGMNSRDSAKQLEPGFGQLLVNGFPKDIITIRDGIRDVYSDSTQVGAQHYFFRGHHPLYVYEDSKNWIFAWAHNTPTKTKYFLKVVDIDTPTPGIALYLDMPNNEEYIGWTRVYNQVYFALEHVITTNTGYPYQKKNLIMFWDALNAVWEWRSMMIDEPAVLPQIFLADSPDNPFAARREAGAVQAFGKLWIMGGDNPTLVRSYNDVWASDDDGYTWYLAQADAAWTPRQGFGVVFYAGKLYLTGGFKGATTNQDCWSSVDGITWVQETASAAFGQRTHHTMLVYNGKMWVIGGRDRAGTDYDDVYSSTDGSTWTLEKSAAAFGQRFWHASTVFDDKMWVVGGVISSVWQTDAWYSTDGQTWTQSTTNYGGNARAAFALLALGQTMYMIGGQTSFSPFNAEDTVRSTLDGTGTWTELTNTAAFGERGYHNGLVISDELVVLCGEVDDAIGVRSDLFVSSDGITWTARRVGLPEGNFVLYTSTFVRRIDDAAVLTDYADYEYPAWFWGINGLTVVAPDERKLTGTVSLSGGGANNLTGSSTKFLSELSINDRVRIAGVPVSYVVTAIASDTVATVTYTGSFTYSAEEASRLPRISATTITSITTSVFDAADAEGIEDTDLCRQLIYAPTSVKGYSAPVLTYPDVANGVGQGATHIRIYRTLVNANKTVARGLTPRYVIDIALSNDTYQVGDYFLDILTDVALQGETNSIEVTGYTPSPQTRYIHWSAAAGRMWTFGDSDNEGYAYYSPTPSNLLNPQKFASWFKPGTNYLSLGPNDGQKATGMEDLDGDMFFFKERSIYMLDNGEVASVPRLMSSAIGCVCPYTIRKVDVPEARSQAILFESEVGPAAIYPGGQIQLFKPFAIDGLWRHGEVLEKSDGMPTDWHTRNKVTAAFWRNTYWVFYGDSRDGDCEIGTNKMFGYHFPEEDESQGSFQFTLTPAAVQGGGPNQIIAEPVALVPVDEVRAYVISHSIGDQTATPRYRIMRWLDPTTHEDLYLSALLPPSQKNFPAFEARTRYLYAGPTKTQWAKLIRGLLHLMMDEYCVPAITVRSDGARLVGTSNSMDHQSGVQWNWDALHWATLISRQGFYGCFFDVYITAKPVQNNFRWEYEGITLILEPTDRQADLVFGMGDLTGDGMFIQKEGAPGFEDDAYP